ncbi:DUF4402 domain-containing protein [Lacibacterium aquatile]|uniref:DUF4402 domain-containing protein n=1 Tax=Lacibacterium aquatile TaxID=1168082 RepID=A0ABW5DYZ8_9PROT
MNFTKRVIGIATISALTLAPVAVSAATATFTATAEIVNAITVTKVTNLSFGKIAASTGSSTVEINAAGVRSVTAGTAALAAGTVSRAEFTIQGANGQTADISVPTAFTMANGGDTMAVAINLNTQSSGMTATGAGTATLALTGAAQTVRFGGSLTVGASQAAGAYASANQNFDVVYQ